MDTNYNTVYALGKWFPWQRWWFCTAWHSHQYSGPVLQFQCVPYVSEKIDVYLADVKDIKK